MLEPSYRVGTLHPCKLLCAYFERHILVYHSRIQSHVTCGTGEGENRQIPVAFVFIPQDERVPFKSVDWTSPRRSKL